jgi:signal transduction histidine kinase
MLSVDRRLGEEPELLEAASSATVLAVEYTQLEGDLRSSLARVAAAGDGERRRIARDLHDCAQQRLVALRIHLSLAGDGLDRPEERAMVEQFGQELDKALSELRDVTHGFYPVVLSRFGIAAALRSAGSNAALPIRIEDHGLNRHEDAIEHAVYFCCLEALQNAAKHAGRGASAVVRLVELGEELTFEVDDDGIGFDPQAADWGTGLVNLADRLSAVGGNLAVESAAGKGTRIRGRIAVH